MCTFPALAGPSRFLLSVLGTPVVVVDVLLLVDKLPSAVVFLMHATSCLRSAGVRPPAWVKTLLGVADADHGDTCGCHSLFGGMFLGRSRPSPLFVPGETLGPFCWTGQRRRFGVVPFLKALCWLWGVCGSQRWWPRRSSARLGVLCEILLKM
jgi:hypothetical protein